MRETVKTYVNCLLEGLIIFFSLLTIFFICFDKGSVAISFHFDDDDIFGLFVLFFALLYVLTYILAKYRKLSNKRVVSFTYSLVASLVLYFFLDVDYSSSEIYYKHFIYIFLLMELAWVVIRYIQKSGFFDNKADDTNSPMAILNPEKDLSDNQKYAVVGLLCYVQGASTLSAYDEVVGSIVQSTINSLGLTKSEVETYVKVSLNQDPEQAVYDMVMSLKEIRDKKYLKLLYGKCNTIANISEDDDTKDVVKEIFEELGVI